MTAATGQPHERVVAWCFVKAVLSEVWTCEEGNDPSGKPLLVAEALEPLLL
jgi:streptomycin 6-kinase